MQRKRPEPLLHETIDVRLGSCPDFDRYKVSFRGALQALDGVNAKNKLFSCASTAADRLV
jgi:hypothetical protein